MPLIALHSICNISRVEGDWDCSFQGQDFMPRLSPNILEAIFAAKNCCTDDDALPPGFSWVDWEIASLDRTVFGFVLVLSDVGKPASSERNVGCFAYFTNLHHNHHHRPSRLSCHQLKSTVLCHRIFLWHLVSRHLKAKLGGIGRQSNVLVHIACSHPSRFILAPTPTLEHESMYSSIHNSCQGDRSLGYESYLDYAVGTQMPHPQSSHIALHL